MNKSFSFTTIENFDTHIKDSIPDYQSLFDQVLKIGDFFVTPRTSVYDLGTSTGKLIRALKERSLKNEIDNVHFIGIEKEKNFFQYHEEGITWYHQDIANYKHWKDIGFATSLFTLQFLSPAVRQKTLQKIYEASCPGSAFVFSEKTYADNSYIQEINTFLYYDWKTQKFSSDEIMEKERSLRSMMRLRTKEIVVQEIHNSGWKICESFWQKHNFVAWIAIKE